MKDRPRPLPAIFALLCLVAPALVAQEARGRVREHPRAVEIGGYGAIERGQGYSPQGRWQGFPISLSLQKAPLPDVLRAFAELADFNLLLDPRIQGTVTVELKDVPWDLALHSILKMHGLGAEVDGTVWMIRAR